MHSAHRCAAGDSPHRAAIAPLTRPAGASTHGTGSVKNRSSSCLWVLNVDAVREAIPVQIIPPLTEITWPVMYPASFEAR